MSGKRLVTPFSAVILAGGESRRMGRSKAWVEVEGEPQVARAAAVLRRAGAVELLISGRADEDYSSLGLRVLLDIEPGLGPMGGIERGLAEGSSPLVLVLAVDLPRMTAGLLARLAAECDSGAGAVPVLHGLLEPLAAIYPARAHSIAVSHLRERRLAVRDFGRACIDASLVRPVAVSDLDAECFANFNSPGDFRAEALSVNAPR